MPNYVKAKQKNADEPLIKFLCTSRTRNETKKASRRLSSKIVEIFFILSMVENR